MQSTFGEEIARWDSSTLDLEKRQKKSAAAEKNMDRLMNDFVEYTKWINSKSQALRERVKKSEAVINDMRTSGEESVESLMETLYMLKIKQEEMDMEAQQLRDIITNKERVIKQKQEQKGAIKQNIEIENADRENQIHALRKQLDEQRQLMDGQTRLLNELQVLCEFT